MITDQVVIFGWSILIGVIIGILFDFFRGMRWEGTKDIWVYLQDILFWIVTGTIIIISTFLINQGELRGYMLIGYLLGAGFYILLFSKYFLFFFKKINELIRKTFHKFFDIIKSVLNSKNRISLSKKQKNVKLKQEI